MRGLEGVGYLDVAMQCMMKDPIDGTMVRNIYLRVLLCNTTVKAIVLIVKPHRYFLARMYVQGTSI